MEGPERQFRTASIGGILEQLQTKFLAARPRNRVCNISRLCVPARFHVANEMGRADATWTSPRNKGPWCVAARWKAVRCSAAVNRDADDSAARIPRRQARQDRQIGRASCRERV